ncbi:hypothetical protein [Novosphingobium sp.]|uniref:hypothetical protein n=1 Tax=Novosphingobium sp. TaxID=1874826 RepID=UPI003D0D6994
MIDKQDWPRVGISALIMVYYGYALVMHYDNGLEETLKNILLIAVGYWLGSAKRGTSTDATGKPGDPVNIAPAPELAGNAP